MNPQTLCTKREMKEERRRPVQKERTTTSYICPTSASSVQTSPFANWIELPLLSMTFGKSWFLVAVIVHQLSLCLPRVYHCSHCYSQPSSRLLSLSQLQAFEVW